MAAAFSRDGQTTRADLAQMREDGEREARVPLQFAGVFAGACAIPLIVGTLRRRRG